MSATYDCLAPTVVFRVFGGYKNGESRYVAYPDQTQYVKYRPVSV